MSVPVTAPLHLYCVRIFVSPSPFLQFFYAFTFLIVFPFFSLDWPSEYPWGNAPGVPLHRILRGHPLFHQEGGRQRYDRFAEIQLEVMIEWSYVVVIVIHLCTLICMFIYLSTSLSAYIFHLRYIHSYIHFQINLSIHWVVLIYLLFPFSHVPPLLCSRLANTIEDEGGVDKIIITHSDNIQDHDKWAARFPNAKRIMHRWVGCDSCVVPPPPPPALFSLFQSTALPPPHQQCPTNSDFCMCTCADVSASFPPCRLPF